MWRIAATLLLVASFVLVNGSTSVSGQSDCLFVGGFARIRDLIGPEKVGDCLEDERFNPDNQNAEQRTAGGLLVWRKSDNFTAFTDGGATWINGPAGLQSRGNNERFPWEIETEPTNRTASTSAPPPVVVAPGRLDSAPPSPASSPAAVAQAAAATATKPPTATATPTAVRTPTKTPNPVEIKITEKPDDADTGSEVKFEVETNGKKGTCSLTITYNDTDAAGQGSPAIDDGKCEWKFIIPSNAKSGTAKYTITVSTEKGSNTKDDEFRVRKGDEIHSGDVSVSLELKDSPGDVSVGESFAVEIETDVGSKGTCDASVTLPKSFGSVPGGQKKPEGGKCSWTFLMPTTITKSGTATLYVSVKNSKGTARTVSKEFDIKVK